MNSDVKRRYVIRSPEECLAQHTYGPDNYVAWMEWAVEMSKTHVQRRCPSCGQFEVWTSKEVADE